MTHAAGDRSAVRISVTRGLRFACSGHGVGLAVALLTLLFLVPTVRLVHYIYFDRGNLPDLERFFRFEIPTTGAVYDARGAVLVELAREYRRVVSYDDVPPVLRDAILAAEDTNFFTHSGVDYRALPPVFREVMLRVYERQLVGAVPQFPRQIEHGIDQYLAHQDSPS